MNVRRLLAGSLLWLALGAGALRGADPDAIIVPRSASTADAPVGTRGAGANVWTLVAVAALAGAGAWMVWRGKGRKGGLGREARQLVIEETRPLGNRQYLVVAAYRGQKFLVGVCPGRIELVAPLSTSAEERSAA